MALGAFRCAVHTGYNAKRSDRPLQLEEGSTGPARLRFRASSRMMTRTGSDSGLRVTNKCALRATSAVNALIHPDITEIHVITLTGSRESTA